MILTGNDFAKLPRCRGRIYSTLSAFENKILLMSRGFLSKIKKNV